MQILKKTKILYKTKNELDRLCGKDQISHQGLIAEIEHLEKENIKDFLTKKENKKNITLACLEEVTDPRNIGSIIRSAASFNIDGLIVKERSFPSESMLLYKSASGCMEHLKIFEVSNLSTTFKYLKTKNFWICGFEKNSGKDFTKHDWNGNNVLLRVDVQGAMKIKSTIPEVILIFIKPDSINSVKKHLSDRGQLSSEQIKTRLDSMNNEIELSKHFDYIIINEEGNIDLVVNKVKDIIDHNI